MKDSDIHNQADSQATPEGQAGATPPVGGEIRRRQGIKNFFAALAMINEASVAESVRQRFSDYVTIGLVIVCVLSLVAAVALPVPAGLKLLPLIFTIGAVIFYIINRLGIVVSLTARQALIVWQVLIASFWLGVTSAMLVMIFCIYFFSQGGSH
jgi:uncharacterized membrane protein